MLEAILEASRHLLVPEMSQNKAGSLARQVAGSLLQVGPDVSCNYMYIKHERSGSSTFPNTEKAVENAMCSGQFLMNFKKFQNLVKCFWLFIAQG